ncbi:hypothetical protein [Phenylobacterium sp.]|jgi:hypothetical protein|uniref:hypothetical protein n=1 Tax=Phenylobacterium sp. TaxID=1871053 RepID=UPI002E364DA5|nr:hypothetical protein [Phenylobacterium sp.]HEX4710216.1 hypothetical protein [Phenylobacterium sp.]
MKHQPIHEIDALGDIAQVQGATLSRRERLQRWADLLSRNPDRQLKPLSRVEFYAERERALLRGENTPISVALADPVLREAGLQGDTLGDAQKFFELSAAEAHYLLCDCHFPGQMDAEGVAHRIRKVATPNSASFRHWI